MSEGPPDTRPSRALYDEGLEAGSSVAVQTGSSRDDFRAENRDDFRAENRDDVPAGSQRAVSAGSALGNPERPRLFARATLSDPLVHFVLLGAVVFAIHAALAAPERPDTIVVTQARIEALGEEFLRIHGRAPEPEQLEDAVHDWLQEEALYREGLRLGLDRDDPAIRQQVINNWKELQLETWQPPAPDAEAMASYIREHRARLKTILGRDPSKEELRERAVRELRETQRTEALEKAATRALDTYQVERP